jgi:hypothetical protein
MHKIATIIIACSDEFHFLDKLLPQVTMFSAYTSVAIGSSRWNGDEENMGKIYAFLNKHKYNSNTKFTLYDPLNEACECEYAHYIKKKEMIPEAYARYIALQNIPPNVEYDYILFLDSDELVEGNKMLNWFNTNTYKQYDVMKLSCYWYWREPIYRANNYEEDSIVMMKKEYATPNIIFHDYARTFFYIAIPGNKTRNVKGVNNEIMIHHYSWCRNKQQMLNKVNAWGHKNDFQNLVELVNEEFSHPFNGTDFLRGYQYDVVDNIFQLSI